MQPYHEEPDLREFTTKIKKITDGKFVELEKSYFYPASGGQPHDLGKITSSNGKQYAVSYVGKFDDAISHQVELPEDHDLEEGMDVTCEIDDERRNNHARAHTAEHILSAIMEELVGAKVTGNQLGEKEMRVDFSLDEFNQELIQEAVNKANEIIQQEHPVESKYIDRKDMDPSMAKLAMGFPEHIQNVRILSIGDFDTQACGGTHVSNTKKIGRIEIIKFKNKGSKNRRVYCRIVDD